MKQHFQSFASTNSYESILNKYKAKKDLMCKTEGMTPTSASSSHDSQYMNFMEKQLEKTNQAFYEAAQQKEVMKDMAQRIEIIELAQQDQARKWGLFVGEISTSKTLYVDQEKDLIRKSIDTLFMKVQELESRTMIESRQNTERVDLQSLMRDVDIRISERLARDFEQTVMQRDSMLEQRILGIIDSQGKDIAMDFTELDRKMNEIAEICAQNTQRNIPTVQSSDRGLAELRHMVQQKVDFKALELFKKSLATDFKAIERKFGKPQSEVAIEKGLKDIEKRLSVKMARALQRFSEVIKTQESKIKAISVTRGLSESRERIYESHRRSSVSPASSKSKPFRSSFKQQALNLSNEASNILMRSLSPSIQDDAGPAIQNGLSEKKRHNSSSTSPPPYGGLTYSNRKQSEFNSLGSAAAMGAIGHNTVGGRESAFRKYQSQLRVNSSIQSQVVKRQQLAASKKSSVQKKHYITSGSKVRNSHSRENSNKNGSRSVVRSNSLSPNQPSANSNIYKRMPSVEPQSFSAEVQERKQKSSKQRVNSNSSKEQQKKHMRSKSRTIEQSDTITRNNPVQSSKQHTLNAQPTNLRSIHDFDTPNFDLKSLSPPHQSTGNKGLVGATHRTVNMQSTHHSFENLQNAILNNTMSAREQQQRVNPHHQCSSFQVKARNSSGGNSSNTRSAAGAAGLQSPISQQSKSVLNASQTERSIQLKVANDRLAQLEKMYEELSVLEMRAGGKK